MPRPKTGRVQLGSNPYVSPELYALCHWRAGYLGIPYGKTLDHLHQLAKESSKYNKPTESNETNTESNN
tara:strand:+ start:413 stop:619 length:207 start_codon:yes stop_codon:yes gene_type:complete